MMRGIVALAGRIQCVGQCDHDRLHVLMRQFPGIQRPLLLITLLHHFLFIIHICHYRSMWISEVCLLTPVIMGDNFVTLGHDSLTQAGGGKKLPVRPTRKERRREKLERNGSRWIGGSAAPTFHAFFLFCAKCARNPHQ